MSNDTPNPTPTTTPAGWYRDHSNPKRERFWDGSTWTAQTRKPPRSWYAKKRVWIPAAIVGLFVVIGLASGGEDPGSEGTDPAAVAEAPANDAKSEEKAKPAEKKVKPVKVDAATLIGTFEKNELKGDQLYKGKTLQVTGVVSQVETDMFDSDEYILLINGGGDFELLSVSCYGLSDKELNSVEPGQDVTVTGKFDDGGSLGVNLKSCSL